MALEDVDDVVTVLQNNSGEYITNMIEAQDRIVLNKPWVIDLEFLTAAQRKDNKGQAMDGFKEVITNLANYEKQYQRENTERFEPIRFKQPDRLNPEGTSDSACDSQNTTNK